MILSNLKESYRIECLHPRFSKLFDFLKSNNLLNSPLGKIELEGDDLFINNIEVEGNDMLAPDKHILELHQKYIDVHILLQGQEIIGWKDINNLTSYTSTYNAVDDCALSDESCDTYVKMKPGQFLIVWPEDAHCPALGSGLIRKAIAKVRL